MGSNIARVMGADKRVDFLFLTFLGIAASNWSLSFEKNDHVVSSLEP